MTISRERRPEHLTALKKRNELAGNSDVRELAAWALPIREVEHLSVVLKSALHLAEREDPNEVAE